jgi:hypothetical protein
VIGGSRFCCLNVERVYRERQLRFSRFTPFVESVRRNQAAPFAKACRLCRSRHNRPPSPARRCRLRGFGVASSAATQHLALPRWPNARARRPTAKAATGRRPSRNCWPKEAQEQSILSEARTALSETKFHSLPLEYLLHSEGRTRRAVRRRANVGSVSRSFALSKRGRTRAL